MKKQYIEPIVEKVPFNSVTIMSGSFIKKGGSNQNSGAPKVADSKATAYDFYDDEDEDIDI